jgi:hypothetical protein
MNAPNLVRLHQALSARHDPNPLGGPMYPDDQIAQCLEESDQDPVLVAMVDEYLGTLNDTQWDDLISAHRYTKGQPEVIVYDYLDEYVQSFL